MKNALVIFAVILASGFLNAQVSNLSIGEISAYPKNMVSVSIDQNGDTTADIMFYTCVVVAPKTFTSVAEQQKWNKLKHDVKAAYPYSVLAKMKLAEMDSQLVTIKGDEARKNFSEKCEKELSSQFSSDVKNLTMTQGKILFKLLDRETGSTTYQIIQQRRGNFSAFMWQGVAVVFGNNLKSEYDPSGDDANIEEVVELIELGVI